MSEYFPFIFPLKNKYPARMKKIGIAREFINLAKKVNSEIQLFSEHVHIGVKGQIQW
jgi:hypothetical protein